MKNESLSKQFADFRNTTKRLSSMFGSRPRRRRGGAKFDLAKPFDWFTTQCNPNTVDQSADAGVRGWKFHAVNVPGGPADKFTEIVDNQSACGLLPNHGWTIDMFIIDRCTRCEGVIAKATKK